MTELDKKTASRRRRKRRSARPMLFFIIPALLVIGYLALRYIWDIDLLDRSGWHYGKSGEVYYLDYYGKKSSGWLEIEGQKYYFNPEQGGKMQTGWLDTDAGRYYLDDAGHIVTQWTEIEGQRFYFHDTGLLATGRLELSDGIYIFDEQGHLQKGWVTFEDARYYLGEDGRVQTGWLCVDGDTYYLKESGQMAVGKVEIDGTAYYFASTGKQLLFVNRWNPVPEGFEPELDQLEGFEIAAACKEQLQRFIADCRASGNSCEINTAYRSYAYQKDLWDYRYNDYLSQGYSPEEAADLSARRVLPPGTSEHQLGLAVDILGPDETFQWLEEHAPEYGFILRYPEGKTEETGVMYEPWHFRYLGTELAEELTALDMTLDAYMDMLTDEM